MSREGEYKTGDITKQVFAEMRDYMLGYARPPKHSQFQKGQSGNPKGRPKKIKLNDADVVKPIVDPMLPNLVGKAMARKMRVRKPGGEIIEMSAEEALTEKILEKAAQGNVAAARLLFDLNEKRRAMEAAEAAEYYAYWSDYKARVGAERAAAQARGEQAPEVLPDPEDIILGPGHRVRIVGPRNEEEREQFTRLVLERDYHKAFLGRSIWKWYNNRPKPKTQMPMFLSMLQYLLHEERLPPRLQTMATFNAWMAEQQTIGGERSYNNLMRAAYAAGLPIPGHRFHGEPVVPDVLVQRANEVAAKPSVLFKGYVMHMCPSLRHAVMDESLLPELRDLLGEWRTEVEDAGFELPTP